MLSQIQHVLACSAGLLLGCGGFILSVLAAGLGATLTLAFDRRALHPAPITQHTFRREHSARPKVLPTSRRSTGTSASSSESPLTPKYTLLQGPPFVASPSEIQQASGPSDYFTVPTQKKSAKSTRAFPLRRCSLGAESQFPSTRASDVDEAHSCSADERTSPFKLTLGFAKRNRAKSVPRVQSPPGASPEVAATPPSPSSTSANLSSMVKGLCPKPAKKCKNLRKVASIPANQLPTLRVWPASPTLKKKQSQPLRTQPYEAPYFFPMPTAECQPPTPPRRPSITP